MKLLFSLLFTTIAMSINAQAANIETIDNLSSDHNSLSYHDGFKRRIDVGLTASTNGFGGYVVMDIVKRFSAKIGAESMSFPYTFHYTESIFEDESIYLTSNADIQTGGLYLNGNYYIGHKFYVTSGVMLSRFNCEVYSFSERSINFNDVEIPPSMIGDINVIVDPSISVSPYLGVVYGSLISSSKLVSLSVEVGTYYMGSPSIDVEATGVLQPTGSESHESSLESQFESYSLYPVIKFNLGFNVIRFR